jgi:hypothetical protein
MPRAIRGHLIAFVLAAISLSCSSAAGDKLNSVSGKVTYKNQPLPGALVTFHPKGVTGMSAVTSTGLTAEDGTFTLTTGQKTGVPAGEYVVTIICIEEPAGKKGMSTGSDNSKDKLQGVYANRDKSQLTATVKAGDNQIPPFDLK